MPQNFCQVLKPPLPKNRRGDKLKIHFIGIGGIGVSALAQYFLVQGRKVSGSDLAQSEITDLLKKKGARIFIRKHKASNVSLDIDLVVYSPAVRPDNPELKEARRLGIKCQSYPEALGELTKKYFTIAVSGTHGKSTTTAMVALILIKAGLDPKVIIGTKLKEFGNSNFRAGRSKYLVIEADEHMASFLNYWPKIIVITNIDKDHLDYYKNLKNIFGAFKKFIGHLLKNGWLVANQDDSNIKNQILNIKNTNQKLKINKYSLQQKETEVLRKILKVPGEHNVSNALAALAVARILKIPDKITFQALSEFRGTWRRFEVIEAKLREYQANKTRKVTIISDYAHHPTEIMATLKAAREKYPKRRIWCVFQPHQYQRTHYLFKDFVRVFSEALTMKALRGPSLAPLIDKLILTEIYDVAGREEKKIFRKVSSKLLAAEVSNIARKGNAMFIKDMEKIPVYLRKHLKNKDVIIIMGAGNIYRLAQNFYKN